MGPLGVEGAAKSIAVRSSSNTSSQASDNQSTEKTRSSTRGGTTRSRLLSLPFPLGSRELVTSLAFTSLGALVFSTQPSLVMTASWSSPFLSWSSEW